MTTIEFTKYSELPDSLEPEETRLLFQELLGAEAPKSAEEDLSLVEAMYEVADRQWHTYELLDETTRKAVDEWVIREWDICSLPKIRMLIFVIGSLGLSKSAKMLSHQLDLELSPEVKQEIEEALREFGANVDDPYSSMKRNR